MNPYVLKFSGRLPPWATVHHVGRSTGRHYATPVVAFAGREPLEVAPGNPVTPSDASDVLVVVPLPWGADVDWFANLQSAGRGRLTRRSTEYRVDRVRVVGADEAARVLRGPARALVRISRVRQLMVGRLTAA